MTPGEHREGGDHEAAGAPDPGGERARRAARRTTRAIVNPLRNPVLARELKERMRQRRAPVVLTVYLIVLGAIMSAVYRGAVGSRAAAGGCFPPACPAFGMGFDVFNAGPDALASASAGRPVFQWVLFFVLMLVCFIVPGVTAGAVASERERQTLVPLQVTLLSPLGILGGKLLASIAFTLLLLVATLPLMTVAYAIGGVSLVEILRGLGMVAVVAAVLGCLSIACSAAFRRVQSATVASYALVFVLVVGTLVAFGMNAVVSQGERINIALLVGNPFVATANALGSSLQGGGVLSSPFMAIQQLFADRARLGLWEVLPFWAVTLLLYAGLAVGSLGLAARRIRVPGSSQASGDVESRRSRRRARNAQAREATAGGGATGGE